MPIIAMHYLGDQFNRFNISMAARLKKNKPVSIVLVHIDTFAVIILLVVYEVDRDLVANSAF